MQRTLIVAFVPALYALIGAYAATQGRGYDPVLCAVLGGMAGLGIALGAIRILGAPKGAHVLEH